MRAPDAQRPGGAAGRVVVKTDRAWALTAALLGIHQAEEVALSIRRWSDRVGPTGWRLFDERIRRNPLAGYSPWGRAAVVAGQGAALYGLYRLTRADAARTRAVTTALTLGWGAAFCMHLGVSWRTRSFMPGTATSIVPGLPGAAFVLWRIRSLTRPDEAR